MDAQELACWTRFAAKGGIGKCTAVVDCIAQEMGEDLMFLKDDEITVLVQLPDTGVYLGHCEGVVGRFSGTDVRFHGKLKKPVIAKRGSVNISHESRTSISLPRESPSNSRPASRASPAPAKSHAPMLSYSSRYSELADSRDTTVVGSSHTSTKSGHAKHPEMTVSVSGASVFSVGSVSVYSEASTATSVYSAADAAFTRSGSRHGSVHSEDTERDVFGDPEYGTLGSDSHTPGSPLASTSTPNTMLSISASTSTMTASASTSGTSFASTSTYGTDPVNGSFGSVGSISELDASKLRLETGFVLVPQPLELGGTPPLRLSKSPRLTASPGILSSLSLPSGEHPRSTPVSPALPSPLSLPPRPPPGLPGSLAPGQRSPGLPGSLSPGFRSPASPYGAHSQAQYTFSSGSNTPSPLPSPYSPPTSYTGNGTPPHSTPLSPPPSSPLPPLPSPVFPGALPVPGTRPVMGTAATAAASGRTSPLAALSSSLPSMHEDEHGVRSGEEGDATHSSTLDAFRQQLDDEADDAHVDESGATDGEDAHSDGEVGIGLSLMGALGGEDGDEEGNDNELSVGLDVNGRASGETALAWTRYEPSSPISAQHPNGHGGENGDEEEDEEDDGAYWDDIYDDYRYSRYSLASKRVSIMSKASGASKASSKARTIAPPMPFPPDRPSFDTSRPGSDGTNGYPRPSFESGSSPRSSSSPLARPSLTRTASEDSTHRSLTAQFPAVPVHVPVRTESRLRIVHDGYMQGSDDHGEKELQVEHGSTEGDAGEVELNIEVTQEDDSPSQEVEVTKHLTPLRLNTALSPLLHTTFGSPHSSRFTDFEDGSDQDHGRRHSNKSGLSAVSSAEGGVASALKATMGAERASPGTALTPTSAQVPDSSPTNDPRVRPIVVDDVPGINITVDGPALEAEATSPLLTPTSNVAQTMVAMDSIQVVPANQPEDAEKSSFLRPRPHPNSSPHPFARSSMFLPHPNAPKAVFQSQGPMYGRTTTQTYTYPSGNGPTHVPTPPGTTLFSTHIMHQLRSASVGMLQGPARRPPMTLFAQCQPELGTSMGPVPILFSLDPFPPSTMPMGTKAPCTENTTPMRAATVSVPARREGVPGGGSVNASAGDTIFRLPKRSATAMGPSLLPIPREGFVPQVGTARPRSRSFSAFGDHVPVTPLPEKSFEEPARPMYGASTPVRNVSLPPALMPRSLPPLVLHSSNMDREPDGSLASPIVQSPALSTHSRFPPSPRTPMTTHSPQTPPVPNMNGALASPVLPSPLANSSDRDASPILGVTGRTSAASSDPRRATSPQLIPVRQGSLDVPGNSSVEGLSRQSCDSSESPLLTSPPPIPEQGPRPSLTQELTLKTKLSLPALRMKASVRSKLDDAVSVASFPTSAENETVQVQDMDFELVKPTLPPVPGRASLDSTLTSREGDSAKPEASPIQADAGSSYSHAPRSPLVPTPPTESAESIDAHRQRELKWMALFPAVPPSQARKNKKVRKLLQDGVPSSVRYLVWCHLTDSKARALPGVYAKLGKRPAVPAFAEIERDALEGFPDQPQLHTAQGPIASLLQAYLSMVPDIQYSSGLTSIAGHLLLLAPEEDAFWIFASMMDAHLRTYFATNTVQIEIDASLFSKALESIDPLLSKKLYMQLSIAPADVTRPWFSTLFVGSLSVDHLHRVWDIFLYDGIPYLYRVGLVVFSCVRHLLMQANTEEAVLAHLAHPPPACLPSPSELLVMAANVKLKDEDVRKQRAKMEQQLKKTTQARPPNGVTNVQTSTISLPKK